MVPNITRQQITGRFFSIRLRFIWTNLAQGKLISINLNLDLKERKFVGFDFQWFSLYLDEVELIDFDSFYFIEVIVVRFIFY